MAMISSITSILFATTHIIDIISPFTLYGHIRFIRPFRNRHAAELRGISADFLILSFQSAVYRTVWSFFYLFPSETVRRQHQARYPATSPNIDRLSILWLDVPLCISTIAFIFLLVKLEFEATMKQLRLRFSSIARFVSIASALYALLVYILSVYVDFDPATGMAFSGLFYIDFIDLLKGIANFLSIVCIWPQLWVNWEEGATVAWGKKYTHLLMLSSCTNVFVVLLRWASLRGIDKAASPTPGRLLFSLHTIFICSILYFQTYVIYRTENEQAWRRISKRAAESKDSSSNGVSGRRPSTTAEPTHSREAFDVEEEGRIGLTPFTASG
ncbi:uncharacterized protein V2V93DRAFT_369506 [Kockiozyma suomiensis]|uniref:uncharacterized protein n=1 Tax=Kockiozyma suomiensis TaxID=1337062 RepID=UPI0033440B95